MPTQKLVDDLGRPLVFAQPPTRIVSLVPSDTYSVVALGAAERLVGRTSYCETPAAGHAQIVGGTKDVDVEAVLALSPQLVLANQEENTRPALEALAAARVQVLVSLPRTVEQGIAHLARIARILGLGADEPARSLLRRGYALAAAPTATRRAFVPIWMEPLMTLNADTFGSDVLARAGIGNAFGDRMRLYPLAADLGKAAPRDAPGRDLRYPRIRLDEIVARHPDLVVLPDEPYVFSVAEEATLRAALPARPFVRISGKDLFWSGAWTIEAIGRIRNLLDVQGLASS